eukprot:GILK01001834.1.p1 GENE.GILK01001834.1~~GILK01001834.1.p1  ORF type:complete len:256 (+),score=28.62 GILK01001834.1:32-769(+)
MDKLRTLDQIRGDAGKDKEKKTTNSYTGGEKSGLAVENPDDVTNRLVDRARRGVGSGEGSVSGGATRVITFWKNGFTVDDGPLRSVQDPANREFLEDATSGVVPRELEAAAQNNPVNLELRDNREREYEPPPPPSYVAYSGTGHSLRSSSSSSSANVKAVAKEPTVDESHPVTTIQFRFHNGQRATQKFNHTHTIQDLHNFVMARAPVSGPYSLTAGFPPAPLTNVSQSLKDAGLLGTAVTQKLG